MRTDECFSKNVSVAKVLAITSIIYGHFWNIHLAPIPLMRHWWVISAIGLLIFSITSGYFTANKYNGEFSLKGYWMKKLWRIGIPLTITNLFLLVIFIFQQREGVWSVQTLASWLGIHGVWTWLRIPQEGPYGAGLWFLTALIIFYALYPMVEKMQRSRMNSYILTAVAVAGLLWLDSRTSLGYTLWLTLSGFFVGVWMARNTIVCTRSTAYILLLSALAFMIVLKFYLNVKVFNSSLMLIASFSLVQACRYVMLPEFVYKMLLPISPCVLSMYIIHMYMFVKPSNNFLLNWCLSLLIILCASFFIDNLSAIIYREFKKRFLSLNTAKLLY